MRTIRPLHQNRFISSVGLIRISFFLALVALVTVPLFTVSSASLAQRFSPVSVQAPGANLLGATKVSVAGARQELSANLNSLSVGLPAAIAPPFALMPQATPTPSIATFDGTGATNQE